MQPHLIMTQQQQQQQQQPQQLPPELIDQTIDHLWDDRPSLTSCSLACRSWLPSSRFHLFRSIKLKKSGDVEKLMEIVKGTPVVARCVRKVSISGWDSDDDDDEGEEENDDDDEDKGKQGDWVSSPSTIPFFTQFDRVHTLALSRLRWHTLPTSSKRSLLSSPSSIFKTVRNLFLFDIKFDASGDVLDFLDLFPQLDELYFHGVEWDRDTVPSGLVDVDVVQPQPQFQQQQHAPQQQQQPHLTHSQLERADLEGRREYQEPKKQLTFLFLDSQSSPTLVTEWVLRRGQETQQAEGDEDEDEESQRGLRTVQLCWREVDDVKALAELLTASGGTLEHLQIEFPEGLSEEVLSRNQLSLSSNTNLRTLHFGGLDVSSSSSHSVISSQLFPWVTLMISQLHSPHLREVIFDLELPDLEDLLSLGASSPPASPTTALETPTVNTPANPEGTDVEPEDPQQPNPEPPSSEWDWAKIDIELCKPEFSHLTVRFYINLEKRSRDEVGLADAVKSLVESRLERVSERGRLRVSCI